MARNQPKHNVSQQASRFLRNGLRALPSRTTSQTYSAYQETVATGGNIFYALSSLGVLYKYHSFTNGVSEFKIINSGTYGTKFDIFLVAGGGGGGGALQNLYGGGGGAGEIKAFYNHPLNIGSYSIQVGAGGIGGFHADGTDGGDTFFNKTLNCHGGKGGKSNGTGGNSGNGFTGGQTVSGVFAGGGGASIKQNGFNAGDADYDQVNNQIYFDANSGGLGGTGVSTAEFFDFFTCTTKLGTTYPNYTVNNSFCFGGGGAGRYSGAPAANSQYDSLVYGYYASYGATVYYSEQAYLSSSYGSGGGGGGYRNYSEYGAGANGTNGILVIRYPLNPSFRVQLSVTHNPFDGISFEHGLPVSGSFTVTGYPDTITHTVTSGSLPTGVSLTSQGFLSGTPTIENQVYAFTVTTTNGASSVTTTKSGTVAPFVFGTVSGAYSDTTSGGYRTIVWRGVGSMNITSGGKNMEVMVLGGGGGGGFDCGGGGGAGVMYYSTSTVIGKGARTITVGAGGASSTAGGIDSSSGGSSELSGVASCYGGGRGGRWANAYGAYPSGGGGSWGGGGSYGFTTINFYSSKGGNATPYYDLNPGYYFACGGGGGATSVGGNGTAFPNGAYGTGGNGGTGKTVFGVTYGDGGGGGGDGGLSRPQALGGSGNGGKGQSNQGASSLNAVAYTGSGGGGSVSSGVITMYAGNGSAGAVIIRYAV